MTPFVVEATADGLIMSLIRSAGSCVGRGDNDDDDDDDDDDDEAESTTGPDRVPGGHSDTEASTDEPAAVRPSLLLPLLPACWRCRESRRTVLVDECGRARGAVDVLSASTFTALRRGEVLGLALPLPL